LEYLTELTHRRPRIWIRDVDRPHSLLAIYGDDALRTAFLRGLAEQAIGAEYIAHYLAETMTLSDQALDTLVKRLHLANTRQAGDT